MKISVPRTEEIELTDMQHKVLKKIYAILSDTKVFVDLAPFSFVPNIVVTVEVHVALYGNDDISKKDLHLSGWKVKCRKPLRATKEEKILAEMLDWSAEREGDPSKHLLALAAEEGNILEVFQKRLENAQELAKQLGNEIDVPPQYILTSLAWRT